MDKLRDLLKQIRENSKDTEHIGINGPLSSPVTRGPVIPPGTQVVEDPKPLIITRKNGPIANTINHTHTAKTPKQPNKTGNGKNAERAEEAQKTQKASETNKEQPVQQPKVPYVTQINDKQINFAYSCGGTKSYEGNSVKLGRYNDFRPNLSTNTLGKHKQFDIRYDDYLKSTVLTMLLTNTNNGIKIAKGAGDRSGDFVSVIISGNVSAEKMQKFYEALNGKLSINSNGRLVLDKQELVNIFNSIKEA